MKASILTIGDEILNGSTTDTNASFIAERSINAGLEIVKMLSVSDQKDHIINALDFLIKDSDFIFITGGLGPTKDDITVKTLSDFTEDTLVFNQETFDRVTALLSKRRGMTIEIDKSRCELPSKAFLLKNQKGTAPGMWFNHKETVLVSMPGVPLEMKQIFEDEVLKKIMNDFKPKGIINKYLLTAGIWESILADKIKDIEENLAKGICIAYLPKLGQVKLRITGKGVSEKEVIKVQEQIQERISAFVYSTDEKDTLEKTLGDLLKAKGKTMTIAESCTGGSIASKIVSIAGSSAFFNGSVVTYSNELKHEILKVDNSTLEKFGAVSQETVLAMAKGALDFIEADYSIAVSGIAGPSGGTEEKPIGTVWIAVASKEKAEAKKFQFWTHRIENIELSSVAALNMLRNFI